MDELKTTQFDEESIEKDDVRTANIMVAGITGVGKSTLLNAIFGSDLAETGKGRPVTSHIYEYKNNTVPIHIWDTVGLELDSEKTKESIKSIRDTIASKADSEDPLDHVHAIWYCINSGSNRYQGAELDFIKNLHSIGVPFIIVLTQCIGDIDEINTFEAQIRDINNSMGMNDIDIVQVCAQDFKLRGLTVPAFGLDDLVQTTLNKLPDFIKGSFIAAQRVSKAQKREYCGDIIVEYVDSAITGFWDKMPIVNFFTTDKKIHKMFSEIGMLYNTIIPEDKIQEAIEDMGSMDLEHGFHGIILPVSKKFDQKVDSFFDEKQKEGFVIPSDKLEHNERAARMLVYFGYLFLEAVEQLWEEKNEKDLKNIEKIVERLKVLLKQKFNRK